MARKPATEASAEAPATESMAVATVAPINLGGAIALNGIKFAVKKQVTVPLLKQKDDEAVYIKFVGAMFVGKEIKNKRDGSVEQKPATLANVVNLETGAPMQYIVGAVLQGTLEEEYPNGGYVGKSFAVLKLPQGDGKRYKNFQVMELETDGEVA